MSATAWWDTLPEDLWRQADGTSLDDTYPFRVRTTAALDRVARTWLGGMISAGIARAALTPGFAEAEHRHSAFYAARAGAGVESVFMPPPADVDIRERAPRFGEWRPGRGIQCREWSFASPFQPLRPDHAPVLAGRPRNRIARAQHWTRAGEAPRPTLLFIHGYFADRYWLNSAMFALPWLFRSGYDVLLYTLPFHGRRAERLDPFSGYGYVSNGTAGINEAMLQAICELRALVDALYRRGAPSVGVSGLSLGGYLSALLACVEPRLAFCIPNSPLVLPVDMGMEWLSLRWAVRLNMWRQRKDLRGLRRAMALHSPLSYAPAIDPARVFIIGGAGDRFTSPRYVRLLHEHWRGSHLHWFPGNHVIHLQRGYYLRLMLAFMNRHSS